MFVDVRLDAGVAGEVLLDQACRLGLAQPGVLRQAVAADAVGDAEVDRLGHAAHVRRHLVQRHVEDGGGGGGVDVLVGLEGGDQGRVLAEVGQDAQLDLRVVGREQHAVALGDEGAPHHAPDVGADRDVLQIGVARRQPAGGGDRLVVRRVHAPGLRVDQQGSVST